MASRSVRESLLTYWCCQGVGIATPRCAPVTLSGVW
jgi:hypothetical protein